MKPFFKRTHTHAVWPLTLYRNILDEIVTQTKKKQENMFESINETEKNTSNERIK